MVVWLPPFGRVSSPFERNVQSKSDPIAGRAYVVLLSRDNCDCRGQQRFRECASVTPDEFYRAPRRYIDSPCNRRNSIISPVCTLFLPPFCGHALRPVSFLLCRAHGRPDNPFRRNVAARISPPARDIRLISRNGAVTYRLSLFASSFSVRGPCERVRFRGVNLISFLPALPKNGDAEEGEQLAGKIAATDSLGILFENPLDAPNVYACRYCDILF